jgi:catechol 2,3-dioxygenase-like lactoylglutathione lyase family enzyme
VSAGGRGPGDLHVGTVVVNVQDMARAVAFWTAALGYVTREREPHPDFTMLQPPSGAGIPVSLQIASEEPSLPVRIHLDLYTDDQDLHVQRLIELGATRVENWPYPADPDFVVLRDPDGNEFCIIDHRDLE